MEDVPRLTALDGLRGLAILLVIPHNADVFPADHGLLWPFAVLAHSGWIGVQLFFVLSGFLITNSLLASRGAPNYYGSFFARRVLRIFPLYFLALFAFLIVLPAVWTLPADIEATYARQAGLWTFTGNWTEPFVGTVHWFPHFWSLAVEEQFYLVWPLVIALIPGRHLLASCVAVILVAIASRCLMLAFAVRPEAMYMFTVCRMDALALGAAAATALQYGRVVRFVAVRKTALLLAGATLLLLGAGVTRLYDTHDAVTISVGYTVLALGLTAFVAAAAQTPGSAGRRDFVLLRLLRSPALRSVGRYSYAMYVFHMLIILTAGPQLLKALEPSGAGRPLLYVAAIAALSYAAGWLSYHGFEKHCLELKHHFRPRCDPSHANPDVP